MIPKHPKLEEISSPKAKKCVKAFREKLKKCKAENEFKTNDKRTKKDTIKAKSKIRRLSHLDVSEFLIKCNIKDTTELGSLALERKKEGKKDLANYVLSRSSKKT